MKASELLPLAIEWLSARYPGALIVPELSIGTWGGALLDVAAITETEIIGIEIKGEGDSPARLPLQASLYSKAATRMFFLPCPALEERCFKHLPGAWGKLVARDSVIELKLTDWERTAIERYGEQPAKRLCTAPGQLLQCLWREDLDAIARIHQVITGKVGVEGLRDKLAEALPLSVLVPETCMALRRRKWINKRVHWAPEKAEAA